MIACITSLMTAISLVFMVLEEQQSSAILEFCN